MIHHANRANRLKEGHSVVEHAAKNRIGLLLHDTGTLLIN